MKNFNKILILLVVISVITSAFVFSASADDTVTDLTGTTWTINGYDASAKYGQFNVSGTIVRASDNHEIQFTAMNIGYATGSSKHNYIHFVKSDGNPFNCNVLINVTFDGGTDVTNTSLISWLMEHGTPVKSTCDGSTCSATDVNLDNVCDDCGMTFSMLREFTPSDFPSGYPSVPSVASDARYYLYRVHSSVHTYIVVYPSTVTPTYDTTKQNGYLTFSESYGSYRLDTTNNEWVLNNDDSPYSIGGTNNNSVDILYSSVTIKDENGENFFPIPLWEKVEKVTQGEIPQFSQTLGGNLMTLTLCGVGLITLLVALYLLSKTFKTYLR